MTNARIRFLTIEWMGIVVDDRRAAIEFFLESGLVRRGEACVERSWADGVVGLKGVRADIGMY